MSGFNALQTGLSLFGLGMGGRVLATQAEILALFASTGTNVAVYRSGDHYYQCQELDHYRYWIIEHFYDAYYTQYEHRLRFAYIKRLVVQVNQEDASVVMTGTWGFFENVASYGGNYRRSVTIGDSATFTTPDGTKLAGAILLCQGSSGVLKVEIDNDATRATLLPTAQDLVDAGTIPSTALVAGGGTLNPTDHVLDQYAYSNGGAGVFQVKIPFVDDLAAGVHTVKITLTAYKNPSASTTRVYLEGFCYTTDTDTIETANSVFADETTILSTASAYEYALQFTKDGIADQTGVWVGNQHAYDVETAFTIEVDGTPTILADGEKANGTTSVEITRTSELFHPAVDAGATVVANSTTVYTMTPAAGLNIERTIGWLIDATAEICYTAMFPLNETFNRCRNILTQTTGNLVTDDGSMVNNSETDTMYLWQSAGNYGALFYAPDLAAAVADFAYTSSVYLAVEDRIGGAMNKVYLTRCDAGGNEDIVNGSTWNWSTVYRMARFDDPADTLG